MEISIKTIPHNEQRYSTCGDYWTDENGVLQIRVSDMGDDRYNALVALHEFIEAKLTEWEGITEQQITDFDMEYERNRAEGNVEEPGFDKNSPYRKQHTIATECELIVAAEAGVDWNKYSEVINSL